MAQLLTDREKTVLELVMENYIYAAEPVGSTTIAKSMKNNLSSATIRNIMGDLESLGFLYKPHAVAGRVPTAKAFRYYVNNLPAAKELGKKELRVLESLARPHYADFEEVMEDTSRVLAAMSSYTSVVVEPRIDRMLFQEVEFIKLSPRRILIVFVTSSGIIHKGIVDTDEDLSLRDLQYLKAYMNERFGGLPFFVLKDEILLDLKRDRENLSVLCEKIKTTLDAIIGDEERREVYIEGTSRMIGVPEFSDVERLKYLFRALENKEKLVRLLDNCLRGEGINVIIGNESELLGIPDMSIIISTYRINDAGWGILGVIGPMRMDYSKIIPIVDHTARTVTDILRIM